jgi:hypothetical protein
MKKKFLIPVLGLFVFAIATTINNPESNNEDLALFVESDNIVYAEGGYTCIPRNWHCPLNQAHTITSYIRRG